MDRALILDGTNTRIGFRVQWLGFYTVRGHFSRLHGTLEPASAPGHSASVRIDAEAGSVDTGIRLRDRHLAGDRFLNAPLYPFISFRSESMTRTGTELRVDGTLAIHGRELQLSVVGPVPADGSDTRLTGTCCVSRREAGVGVPNGVHPGRLMYGVIGDEICIDVEIRAPGAAALVLRSAQEPAGARPRAATGQVLST